MPIPLIYIVRNLWVRRLTASVSVVAIGLVVLVFVSLTALVEGMRATITETGLSHNLLLLSPGSISVATSQVEKETLLELRAVPEVESDATGDQLISPELLVSDDLFYKGLGQTIPTPLRGVEPIALKVHEGVHLAAGRPPQPNGGIMLGRRVSDQLHAGVGDHISIGSRSWEVVGVFEAKGSSLEAEIWLNLADLQTATRRNNLSTAVFRISSVLDPDAIANRLSSDSRLHNKVMTESRYYAEQVGDAQRIWLLTLGLSVMLGIAAAFAAMNTMYSAVASRVHEIGVLRALGYSRRSVLQSFCIECCLLSMLGGLAAVLSSLLLNGVVVNTINAGNFLAFSFRVTPAVLASGIILSVLIGAAGGFFPARAAAALRIADAIRAP